jgi:hypothetical protein
VSEDAYARKEGFPTKVVMIILAAIVVALWFVVGQGYFTTPLSESSQPPTIWLTYEGALYSGQRGSYCWANKCVDVVYREPAGIIDVTQGTTIEFVMNTRTRPTVVSVPVFMTDSSGNLELVGELVSEGNYIYNVDLQKGVYVLQLQAIWQDLGDVNYAFKIRVS